MDDKMHSKRLGLWARLGLALTGANPERARWAGHDDQSRLVEVGVSLVLLFAWIGWNVAHAAEIATGQPLTAPMVWVMAGLIAGLYMLVDRSLIRARTWSLGRTLARARGFGPAQPRGIAWGDAAVGALAGLVRLGLALAVAAFCAMSFVLWWWAFDIAAEQSADLAQKNAALRLRIEAEVDRDIAAASAELDRLETTVNTRAALAAIQAEAATKAAAGSRLPLQRRLDDLDQRIAAGRDAIDCAQRTAKAELDAEVVTCTGEAVAIKGDGPRYEAAMAEAALLQVEVERLVADRIEVEAKLADLATAGAVLAEPDPDLERLDDLRAQRAELLDGRAAVVVERMVADPAYVAPTDGLSIRLSALSALMQREPLVLVQVAITVAMFLLLDLAVLSIAVGRQGASIYAVRQVVEFETRAAHEIAQGEVSQAEAATKALAAQVAQLQTRLDLARAERAIRDELRRMDVTEGVLDAWAADLAQTAAKTRPGAQSAKTSPQHFDA